MLLTTKKSLPLSPPPQKLLHIVPAHNNTYITLSIHSDKKVHLSHLNWEGKVLKERVFEDGEVEEMGMLNDRSVVVVDRGRGVVGEWNVETGAYLEVGVLFLGDDLVDVCKLFVFGETRTLCIVQLGHDQSNILKLTYLSYPSLSLSISPSCPHPQPHPLLTHESDSSYTPENILRKANNHSMICWMQMYLDTNPVIKVFYLNEQLEGVYREWNLREVDDWALYAGLEISVSQVWEMRAGEFLVVGVTDQEYSEANGQYPNTNFVYSTHNNTFRRANFTLPQSTKNQTIDINQMGQITQIRTYSFHKGIPSPTPIFYIHNPTEQILATQYWQCSHLYKYQTIASMPSVLIECQYQNWNVGEVVVGVKEVLGRRMMVGFMVEEVVNMGGQGMGDMGDMGESGVGCDQDLVELVVRLIGD